MRCIQSTRIVDNILTNAFHRLGYTIGQTPGYFITVPIFLTLLACTGFQQIVYEKDPEYLFSPYSGQAKQERQIFEKYFPQNFSRFDPSRVLKFGVFVRVLITSKNNTNLFSDGCFQEIVELDNLIRDVAVTYGHKTYRYLDVCSTWNNRCADNSIVGLQKYIPQIESHQLNVTFPFWYTSDLKLFLVLPAFLGSPEISSEGYITNVPALQMNYWAKNNTKAYIWETSVLEMLEKQSHHFKHIEVARFASQSLEKELEENTRTVIPYMTFTTFVMIAFCVIASMMGDCVRSKPLCGLMGVTSATMATLSAFGLLMYCRVPFIGINMAAPFLMLGIGIDDTFVILAAWRRTSAKDSVSQRLATTYSEAAVSITITSLTDMFSFIVGAITPFPSVQIFCLYTGLSVVFTYMWHITFFGGILALFGYAESQNRHCITFTRVLSPSASKRSKSRLYYIFCSGGIDTNIHCSENSGHDKFSRPLPCSNCDEPNRDHIVMSFFRDHVAKALTKPVVKAMVLVFFLFYIGIAIIGCTQLKEGLERRRLSKYGSYSERFYDVENKYFRQYPYRIQVLIEGEYDYFNKTTQDRILKLLNVFENSSYVEKGSLTKFWLRDWKTFTSTSVDLFNLDISTREKWFKELRKIYLKESDKYSEDVVFDNDNSTIIKATRFIVQSKDVCNTVADKSMMEELRDICLKSDIKCHVYHPLFVFFDQFILVRQISLQAISIAAVIMCVVSLIFIPNPICCMWVGLSIASIEIGVLGYMSLWNVNLDSISMINLIMCIGFSVDFSAHISYAYMSAPHDSTRQHDGQSANNSVGSDARVRHCLYALGLPILQAGMSTVCGILPLYFAPSYIFVTFFKTNFLVVFFGIIHGLFLLPVLLSLFGPGSRCCSRSRPGDKSSRSTQHTLVSEGIHNNGYLSDKDCANNGSVYTVSRTDKFHTGSEVRGNCAVQPASIEEEEAVERDLGLGTSGENTPKSSISKPSSGEACEYLSLSAVTPAANIAPRATPHQSITASGRRPGVSADNARDTRKHISYVPIVRTSGTYTSSVYVSGGDLPCDRGLGGTAQL